MWMWLGALLFAYAFNSVSLSQGGPAISALTIDSRPVVLSIYAIIGLSVLLSSECVIGLAYVAKVRRWAWCERLPFPESKDDGPVDRSARLTKTILLLMLVGFVLLPTYALGYHWRKVVNSGVVFNKSVQCEAVPMGEALPLIGTAKGDRIANSKGPLRIVGSEFDAARGQDCKSPVPKGPRDLSAACEAQKRDCFGVSWTRVTYPLGLALATLTAVGLASHLLVRVFAQSLRTAWRRIRPTS
jgi:hypothetical protein